MSSKIVESVVVFVAVGLKLIKFLNEVLLYQAITKMLLHSDTHKAYMQDKTCA